jgi:hypothetical protein
MPTIASCSLCGDPFRTDYATEKEAHDNLDVCDPCFDHIIEEVRREREGMQEDGDEGGK